MDIKASNSISLPVTVTADRAIQNKAANAPERAQQAAAAAPQAPATAQNHPEHFAQAVKTINATLKNLNQNVEFTIDEDSQRTVVKVIDQETKQVLRQMPSQEALDIASALDRLQGLLIRQEA